MTTPFSKDDAVRVSRTVVDSLFNKLDNPNHFISHHLESYNFFFSYQLYDIFKNSTPILLTSDNMVTISNEETIPKNQCHIYLGGKSGDRLRFSKPVVYEETIAENGETIVNSHYMTPNEARLQNMNYSMPIHYDMEVDFEYILDPGQEPLTQISELSVIDHLAPVATTDKNSTLPGNSIFGPDIISQLETALKEKNRKIENIQGSVFKKQTITIIIPNIHLGTFPIMTQSRFCIMSNLTPTERFQMGECRNDMGGYFIIEGKEKVIIPQEQFADNVLYVQKGNSSNSYSHRASVRSVSENVNKPDRTFSIELVKPTSGHANGQIVVKIPNVTEPIPVFILFRAFGLLSDKDIIRYCILNIDKNASLLESFRPSVHDGRTIYTQNEALMYIAAYTRFKKLYHVMHLLSDFVLAHIGGLNFKAKLYYLGYMCRQLILTDIGAILPTDRDHFKFKRVLTSGAMIKDLFREYFSIYHKHIFQKFESFLNYNRNKYNLNMIHLIVDNQPTVTASKIIHEGFVKAFKGNWGAHSHTKKVGVVQDMNRLSFNGYLSHLRKTSITLDSTSKIIGPRLLHCTQQYYFDPLDTPDGENIGIHKNMAVSTQISRGYPRIELVNWLIANTDMILIEDCFPEIIAEHTRVFINGFIAGKVTNPLTVIQNIKFARRIACLPLYTSVSFDYTKNIISLYTDEGRVVRPIFYRIQGRDDDIVEMSNRIIYNQLERKEPIRWNECIYGKRGVPKYNEYRVRSLEEIYEIPISDIRQLTKEQRIVLEELQAPIDLIDPNETESSLIATDMDDLSKSKYYTNMEINNSFLFGIMVNQVMFPEFNPPARNLFSCGQTKQAVSMYSTNFPVRMDKMAVVLNYAEVPLVKTDYLKYTCNEENMYGHNAMVAIGCYTGYNVEDAVLINEAAIQRGLFSTTYYTTYSSHEKTDNTVSSVFENVMNNPNITHKNGKYNYSYLEDSGIIKEGTQMSDRHILIGQSSGLIGGGERKDVSTKPKREQLGIVDRVIVFGKEGGRTAKVRVAELRTPAMGDKMASRAGQKGTIGQIVPEEDMPFTADGIRPDIIVNPHAFPSRMTVCHLLEALFGSVAVQYGAPCNSTAYNNEAKCMQWVNQLMQKSGLHSMGDTLMYNGMSGEQMEMALFLGPTYYMRLKHMVKDKMNYRAEGPNDQLTRQPMGGRAADGGLRIGEMERDVIVSHGMESFMHDTFMTRSDKFYMAVCNTTGNLFVYNPELNRMFSPSVDGPLTFYKNMLTDDFVPRPLTHYNHSFSIVEVPYSFKLLMQEVQAAGVQMRLITEDNIREMTLSSSAIWNKLTGTVVSSSTVQVEDLVQSAKQTVEKYKEENKMSEDIINGPGVSDIYRTIHVPTPSQSKVQLYPYTEEHVNPIPPMDSTNKPKSISFSDNVYIREIEPRSPDLIDDNDIEDDDKIHIGESVQIDDLDIETSIAPTYKEPQSKHRTQKPKTNTKTNKDIDIDSLVEEPAKTNMDIDIDSFVDVANTPVNAVKHKKNQSIRAVSGLAPPMLNLKKIPTTAKVIKKDKKEKEPTIKQKTHRGKPKITTKKPSTKKQMPLIGDLVVRREITIDGQEISSGDLYKVITVCNNDEGNCWITIQKYDIVNNDIDATSPPKVVPVGELELYKRQPTTNLPLPVQNPLFTPTAQPNAASPVTIIMNAQPDNHNTKEPVPVVNTSTTPVQSPTTTSPKSSHSIPKIIMED